MNRQQLLLDQWTFKACDGEAWLPAQVPGCVHTDLLRNGQIPDPFYGTNEHDLQWIDKKDWEYQCSFEVSAELLEHNNVELAFDGLDTYADVYLNDTFILGADNMFRSWRIPVKEALHAGSNSIRIVFRSPIQEDLPKLEQLGYPLPASNDQSELGGLGEKRVSIFARKAPYHYGWDWGPRFVTSGIWRPCRLEAWSGAQIRDLFIRQDSVTAGEARLTAVAAIDADSRFDGVLAITTEGHRWEVHVKLESGSNTIEIPLVIQSPELWWCRGLGAQNLYRFDAVLLKEGSAVTEHSVRTGLRSVQLVRKADEAGASFYIELNGTPVFAKGANHIPNDSFLPEVTYERYRHEIASAAESNMNMLRVWGGGIYEDRMFYELCDEYGLMVWQDFMFACSMYPGDEAFLNSVRLEAEDNVTRLRNHPSIVLWCGNNEIDSAWAHFNENAGWGWKKDYTPEQREIIWRDYEAVFHHILPEAVSAFAPGAAYWPSSPLVSLSGDIKQHAHPSTTEGDIHYWGVWHNVEPFDHYNKYVGRFMSEYGFQSFPEPKTVRTYAEESDMELESTVMLAHQKNGAGNRLIKNYMDIYMNEPKDFESFLYMSQMLQAEAMKTAIEAHRKNKPYCMGTLYWQMNDCWPVASWAGMDSLGRWKALQYAAKRSFRDIIVVMEHKEGVLSAYIISDSPQKLNGNLQLKLLSFEGETLWSDAVQVDIEAQAVEKVFETASDRILAGRETHAVVLAAELQNHSGEQLDSKTFCFLNDRDLRLQLPVIRVTEAEGSEGTAFVLESDVFARQVWLSSEAEGIFSDNYFDLLPGEKKRVEFRRRSNGETPFETASPGEVKVMSMAHCIRLETVAARG